MWCALNSALIPLPEKLIKEILNLLSILLILYLYFFKKRLFNLILQDKNNEFSPG